MANNSTNSPSLPVKPFSIGAFGLLVGRVKSVEKELRDAGITSQPYLVVDYSKIHRRYVLCANECGGASKDIGHYFGFLALRDDPAFFLNPVAASPANTVHARFAASAVISIEMFRLVKSYCLSIHLHWLVPSMRRDHPPHHRQKRIFYGSEGVLGNELWLEEKSSHVGAYIPTFYTRTGDPLLVPESLREAVGAITDAVCCVNCRKSHLLAVSPVVLPNELKSVMVSKPVLNEPAAPIVEIDPKIVKARKNRVRYERRKKKRLRNRELVLPVVAASPGIGVPTVAPTSKLAEKLREDKTRRNRRNNDRRKRKRTSNQQQAVAELQPPQLASLSQRDHIVLQPENSPVMVAEVCTVAQGEVPSAIKNLASAPSAKVSKKKTTKPNSKAMGAAAGAETTPLSLT